MTQAGEIKFKRIEDNKDLPLPAYATPGAAGMDLRAFLPQGSVTFKHGDLKLISTGFCVELPSSTEMQVRPRSGLALKHGFIIPNSPGTVDEDFRGCVMVGLYYLGEEPFTIQHGDRIAQAVIAQVQRFEIVEAKDLSGSQRGSGGFGSTGLS
jgi:dUTP pyrophosphatase